MSKHLEISIKKVTIFGAGYVGMSYAALFGQKCSVSIYDLDSKKVDQINNKKSPISDEMISEFLLRDNYKISAYTNMRESLKNTDLVIISLPTDFDEVMGAFNTSIIEKSISELRKINKDAFVLIKSTVPVGFSEAMVERYDSKIIFSPEFLREGNALEDNIRPSRIIIGSDSEDAERIGKFLLSFAENDPPLLIMTSSEAEAVKLFSNTYLAMRVSFFNELDTFCLENGMSSDALIKGICFDPRIGDFYNNPSFGYGGYCLPKDSKQMETSFYNIPQNLISATIKSNMTRKEYLSEKILESGKNIIGIYRLIMKSNSDNFRESAIFDLINLLKKKSKTILIFEPLARELELSGVEIIESLEEFKTKSEIIIANRNDQKLDDVSSKVFTRDLFQEN